ncbi:MAG: dienelactone hydrolase family protein [Pirellulales bacterium]|nr:dienelactone hydrolase family protein [Pirellulales bacterium]
MERSHRRGTTLHTEETPALSNAASRIPRDTSDHVCLFGPLHYEPDYAYPLIVWLHGNGGSESDARRVMPHISMQNFVAVAPRGTQPVTKRKFGHRWSQKQVNAAEIRVLRAVELAEARFNIGENRVFLAGFDSGATMAYRLAFAHPERFAGVIAACGGFPSGRRPFARLAESRDLPVLMLYGEQSDVYPAEDACADLRLFHAAGLDITLRQYPCGQSLSKEMLADVNRWIMERLGAVA